jgi:dipeptidyl aminopeptidase/acylaminoacyl peptidase
MKVRVVCYEGYRAVETPRAFTIGERRLEVTSVSDRWRGEDHEYVKLDASDGNRYILRYDSVRDEWEIYLMEAGRTGGR